LATRRSWECDQTIALTLHLESAYEGETVVVKSRRPRRARSRTAVNATCSSQCSTLCARGVELYPARFFDELRSRRHALRQRAPISFILSSVMPESVKLFRVFVASPGDVVEERERLVGVVAELNRTIGAKESARLELVRWETDVLPGIGADAQDVINAQLEPVQVFIAILWNRLGTPTKRGRSGTVEEFERALASFSASGCPRLMLYFRQGEPGDSPLEMQAREVAEFRSEVAQRGALFREYSQPEQFTDLVREHLAKQLYSLLSAGAEAGSSSRTLKGEALESYRYLVADLLPACRNLIRVADDLHTNSDHYLAVQPPTVAVFGEQISDMNRSIAAYNDGWNRLYRQRMDFEDVIESLRDAPSLRELTNKALSRSLDFERGYATPSVAEPAHVSEQFEELSSDWRERRVALHSTLVRAREALEEVERLLETIAREAGARAPEPDPQSAWETSGLLVDYRQSIVSFAAGIEQFVEIPIVDGAKVTAAAWALVAPGIMATNEAYTALEDRSLPLRLTLLASGTADPAYVRGAELLERAERFQWHELRPSVNTLVSLIIPVAHGDHRESTLRRLRGRVARWRELVEVLRHGARRIDPGAAFPRS